jgi:hypothetical protein
MTKDDTEMLNSSSVRHRHTVYSGQLSAGAKMDFKPETADLKKNNE